MKKVLAFTATLICLYIFFYILENNNHNNNLGYGYGMDNLLKDSILLIRPLILTIFTFLGITSRQIVDKMKTTSGENFLIKKFITEVGVTKSFWLSVIISPIVIMSFYSNISVIESKILIALLSYQNGFFFNTLLKD